MENRMTEEQYEEKKQEALTPIFVTGEKSLEFQKQEFEKEKIEFTGLKKINSELTEKIQNLDKELGEIFRDFEKANIPTQEVKQYMGEFWDYLCKILPERLESKTLRKKIEKRKKEQKIKNYQKKLKELKSTVSTGVKK